MSVVAPVAVDVDVDAVAEDALRILDVYRPRERVLPPGIAERTSGDTTVRLKQVILPGLGDLRTLTVEGPDLRIAQLLSMPRPDRDVGLFRAELVIAEGRAPAVAVDVHALSETASATASAVRVLSQARRLVGLDDAEDATSPAGWSHHAVVRSEHGDHLRTSLHLIRAAWALQVYELVLAPRLDMGASDEHFQQLEGWRADTSTHMQARPLLADRFGADWTARCIDKHWLS